MHSVGQDNDGVPYASNRPHLRLDAEGFTMVVLLVVMAVMAVGMTALLPTWRQQAIREQEEELVFRGNQYARALVLYARKNNNLLPANIDVLYTGKFLRKKYKDPITGEDFGLLGAGETLGAAGRGLGGQSGQSGRSGGPPNVGSGGVGRSGGGASQGGSGGLTGDRIVGSIQGFYSKSTATSIRRYQLQERYIDWPFTVQTAQMMMGPGRVGGPGGGPGGTRFGGDGGIGDRGPGGRGPDGRTGLGGRGGATPPGGRGTPTGGGRGGRAGGGGGGGA